MQAKKIIIVGAGFGGLSAGALLAQQGHDVTIVEKNEQVGGRASVWQKDGFVFDMGPSWYLMPEVFERFFNLCGKKASDYYTLKRLPTSYRIFFAPDDYIDITDNLDETKALFEKLEPGSSKKFDEYLAQAAYQYKVSIEEFLYKEYTSIFDFFSKRMLIEGSRLHVFENMEKYVSRYFTNEKLRRILQYHMVFLGGTPKNTPAIYSLLSHVDFNLGVWYPDGGIGKVAEGLAAVAREQGCAIMCDNEVLKINSSNGKVTSITTKQGDMTCDLVVVNADYQWAETKLLSDQDRTYSERYWNKRTIAPSGFVIYLGVNKKLKNLQHHSLYFGRDWMQHFDAIFKAPDWPTDPSYYICTPSKTDPTTAPEGKENIFILVPVASGLDDSSDTFREGYARKIIRHLESVIGETFESDIIVKRIFSHRDFSERYHAFKGTALGLSHTLMQTALFRPQHKSKKVEGLYYTGQYTHPGIGMPMTLISSEIVSNVIKEDTK